MKWIALHNKEFDKVKCSNFNKYNIATTWQGKPIAGTWFSLATVQPNNGICQWNDYLAGPSSEISSRLLASVVNEKNTTFCTELELKPTTKIISLSQIEEAFDAVLGKSQILRQASFRGYTDIVLSIDTEKDFKLIEKYFPKWRDKNETDYSEFWSYVTQNFEGCQFTQNFFNTKEADSAFLKSSLCVPSFVVFNNRAFEFNCSENFLHFNNTQIDEHSEDGISEFIKKYTKDTDFTAPTHLKNLIIIKKIIQINRLINPNYFKDNRFANQSKPTLQDMETADIFLKEHYNIDIMKDDTIGYVSIKERKIYGKDFEELSLIKETEFIESGLKDNKESKLGFIKGIIKNKLFQVDEVIK
jgi:hypothetical protein